MIYAIIVGLIIGALAGWFMKSSYAWYIDLLLGIVGSWVGNWLFGVLGINIAGGLVGDLITGVVGAVIVIAIARLIKK
ncbi:MAG: GlsB/YeaQ/YmgE family stress response membrane protein [Bacteroidales bacterium]|nr:GlsB/YeaQ/YmgE family stress response membrane protein [Bacteroidales bacterium]